MPFRAKQSAESKSLVESVPDQISMVQPVARATPLARKTARILIIDDDPGVIKVLQRVLAGHDIVVTTNAKHALAHISSGLVFDMVLCDLMMPEMSGEQLHSAILEKFPEQAAKMVFLTGGTFDPETSAFLDSTPNRSIKKPFSVAELLALVTESVE